MSLTKDDLQAIGELLDPIITNVVEMRSAIAEMRSDFTDTEEQQILHQNSILLLESIMSELQYLKRKMYGCHHVASEAIGLEDHEKSS